MISASKAREGDEVCPPRSARTFRKEALKPMAVKVYIRPVSSDKCDKALTPNANESRKMLRVRARIVGLVMP